MTKPYSTKGATTTYLLQNQPVTIVIRKDIWMKIDSFNYISGIHENGRCLKKYLKFLRHKKIPKA